MKNNLITTKKTEVVLAKGKSLLDITAKILSGSKVLAEAAEKEPAVQGSKDVTIIDDLMWENVADPDKHRMSWYDAMEYAKNLRLGGYDDWRLPTIEELRTVVRKCGGINVTFGDDGFEAVIDKNLANESYLENCQTKGFFPEFYWSSTSIVGYEDHAWDVSFHYGYNYSFNKSGPRYVRCVRAGE